jgi:hypothetical protein
MKSTAKLRKGQNLELNYRLETSVVVQTESGSARILNYFYAKIQIVIKKNLRLGSVSKSYPEPKY